MVDTEVGIDAQILVVLMLDASFGFVLTRSLSSNVMPVQRNMQEAPDLKVCSKNCAQPEGMSKVLDRPKKGRATCHQKTGHNLCICSDT